MDTYADAHTNALTESWKSIPADKQDAMQTFLLNDPDGTRSAYRQAYAFTTSHDSVQYSPTARQMTADTVDHGGPLISRRARSLAGSIGLPL